MSGSGIKIGSLNVDSLRSRSGLSKVLMLNALLQTQNIDILLIQDTHVADDSPEASQLRRMSHLSFHNHCPVPGHAGVIIILRNNKARFTGAPIFQDQEGRILISEVRLEDGAAIIVANCYGPPNRQIRWEWARTLRGGPSGCYGAYVAAGDWNLVTDPKLDRECVSKNHTIDQREFGTQEKLLRLFGPPDPPLIDGWRSLNPKLRDFSHLNRGHGTGSRIDRIYVHPSWMVRDSDAWEIIPPGAVHTDHKLVVGLIRDPNINETPRGKGLWMLKATELSDPVVMSFLRTRVTREDFSDIHQWLALKAILARWLKVRSVSRVKATRRKWKFVQKRRTRLLRTKISPKQCAALEHCNAKLEEMFEMESYHYLSRSLAKDYLLGERPTKYFYARTRAQQRRSIEALYNESGDATSDVDEMLDIAYKFYKNLYNVRPSDPTAAEEVFAGITNRVPVESWRRWKLLRPISNKEVALAIKGANIGRSAGPDGLPVEIYRLLLRTTKSFLPKITEVMRDIQGRHSLPPSFVEGCLVMLYKYPKATNKDSKDIRNYRPLTLLNADYKIYSSIMMVRLVLLLDKQIGPQQYAFLPGRKIGDNIKLVQCLIDKYSSTFKNGDERLSVLFLDLVKGYDMVSHSFMWTMLRKLRAPVKLVKMLQPLYNGKMLRVKLNGHLSAQIPVLCGVGQGDPVSCPLYLVVIEALFILLRAKGVGIPIAGNRTPGTGFADDTTVTFPTDSGSGGPIMNCINTFQLASGGKVNWPKSTLLVVGEGTPDPEILQAGAALARDGTPVTHLGIPVGVNIGHEIESYWKSTVDNMAAIVEPWLKCHLSFRGRILIAKAKLISLSRYAMTFLPVPDGVLHSMEAEVWKLIWNGSDYGPVSRVSALLSLNKGGLSCLDLPSIRNASAVAMVARMEQRPDLDWVRLAVGMIGRETLCKGRTKRLHLNKYSEPWRQQAGLYRVSPPPSISYFWRVYNKYALSNPANKSRTDLIRWYRPESSLDVLRTKHWYFPDLEDEPPTGGKRQGAKVWASQAWQDAAQGAFGKVDLIGDLFNPLTKECVFEQSLDTTEKRFNTAVHNLIDNTIPAEWRSLLYSTDGETARQWLAKDWSPFHHCMIRTMQKDHPVIPLRNTNFTKIYEVLVHEKTKGKDFWDRIEGPRRALSSLLGRDVDAQSLWSQIRRYERKPKANDLLWKFLHQKIQVGDERTWIAEEKRSCSWCTHENPQQAILTTEHLWLKCPAAKHVWYLVKEIWRRITGTPISPLPRSKVEMIGLFAVAPYTGEVAKSRWITLYTAAVWILWTSYLNTSIENIEYTPGAVRARFWDYVYSLFERDRYIALDPRKNHTRRTNPSWFLSFWGVHPNAAQSKVPPEFLRGLRTVDVDTARAI